jgi:hypothetical protein
MNLEVYTLKSGRPCTLSHVPTIWLRHYFVLTCGGSGDPTTTESAEFLSLALREARRLALERVSDAGRYTLIFSGPKSRRRSGSHVHILLSFSRFEKAWLYTVLAGKNLVQGFGLRRDKQYRAENQMKPNTSPERTRGG